jgi:hypothetical protein
MSFGGNETTADPVVAGTEEEDVSTNQEAVPIPYLAGERKVAVRWLSNAYKQYSVEVKADSGKKGGGGKKGSSASTGVYDYFASIAGAVCFGTVDHLAAIVIDNKQVWADPYQNAFRESSPNPYVGTIPGYGTFHFYWGTESQSLDLTSVLLAANNETGSVDKAADNHPPYRGIAFIEFRDLLFGREKVSAPNIEIVVGRKPVQSLITGVPTDVVDNQVNPLTAVAELLTNYRYGLGQPSALFNLTSFQDTAANIELGKALTYCSPFMNEQTTLRSVLADMYALSDSFLTWEASTAKIKAGFWLHGESIDASSLPLIVDENMTQTPDFDASGWDTVKTGFSVTFADRERLYKESSEKFDDLTLIDLVGEPSRDTLARPWITRRDQARAHATEWCKSVSRPSLTGKLTVRRKNALPLVVGSLFQADIDAEPSGNQLRQVFRLEAKEFNQTGSVDLTITAENNLMPLAYTVPSAMGTDDTGFAEPSKFIYVRPMELPPDFSNADYGIAVLAQRADNLTVGYGLLYDDEEGGSYITLGTQRTFGVRATLLDAYSSSAKSADDPAYDPNTDAPVLDMATSNLLDLDNVPDDLGLVSARENQLLLIIAEIESTGVRAGQIKLDANGFAIMEILSVSAMTVPEAGYRAIEALRGRFSTGARSFSAGAEAWLIRKSSVTIYTHKDFPVAAESPQQTCFFKTEPFNIFQSRDISEDASVPFLFPTARFFAPKIEYQLPLTGPFAGVPYILTGTLTDKDANMSSWSVSYYPVEGGQETVVAGGPLENTGEYPFSVPITFLRTGSYKIVIRVKDVTAFTDSYVEETIDATVTIASSEIDPPSGLTTITGFKSIWLEWTNPVDEEFDSVEIWVNTVNNIASAQPVITTGAAFAAYSVEDVITRYFWIRSKDRSGNKSAFTPGATSGVVGVARNVLTSSEVEGAGVEIVDTLPVTGLTEGRVVYLTTDKKIYRYTGTAWTSAVDAVDVSGQIAEGQIATNAITADKILAGAITAAKVGTNEIITAAANIGNAVITSAKIASLSVAKLATGEMTAAELTMSGTGAIIKSANFSDTAGFQLKGDGSAKVASLEVRGNAVVGTGADGVLVGSISATGVEIYSPDNLALALAGNSKIRLYIKRPAGGSLSGTIWFKTGTDTTWDVAKSKTFTMTAGDDNYQTYLIDMSTVAGWTGTLKQLRLDPVGDTSTGTFRIGFVRIENDYGAPLTAWNFTATDEGWTGNASLDTLEWATGDVNILQSANYIQGVSGWAIKGNGAAEFWDVNIYGSVAFPIVFAGATQLTTGNSYGFLETVTLTISSPAGTTSYYRTDGQVPTGQVSEQVPSSGIVTLTAYAMLRIRAYENSTGRSSDIFGVEIGVSKSSAFGGRPPDSFKIRIRSYYDSPYVLFNRNVPNANILDVGAFAALSWTAAAKNIFYDTYGNPKGFVFNDTATILSTDPARDLFFFHASGTTPDRRIGSVWRRIHNGEDSGITWGSTLYKWNESGTGSYTSYAVTGGYVTVDNF